ncbi:MAG: putative 2-aminoethylphosphonate ABC transporter substrate-binding protein [Anaerovorax sp.]
MKKKINILFVVILVLVINLAFSGCVSKNTEGNEKKGDIGLNEQELNVYTALEDDLITDYLAGFKTKYPDVKVNITRDSTGIITAKLMAEKENPIADVVWGTAASSLLVLDGVGLLEPYAPVGVDRILPEFKDSAATPKWVGMDAWETAFLVNKAVLRSKGITDVPASYADLADPKYKGLIAMSNPASSGTGLLTVNGILTLMGEKEGWSYMDKLNENVAVYLHSGSAPAKNTATGEYGIGVSFGYRCIKSAKDLGDKGVVVFPSEGSGWDVEANALIKKDGGTKEIAKKFLDWAIEDEPMDKYATNYPIVATGVSKELPEGYSKNPMEQLIKGVDLQWCAKNRDSILAEWTARYDGKSAPKEL